MSAIRKASDTNKPSGGLRLLWSMMTWFIFNLVALVILYAIHFLSNVSSMRWWADIFALMTNLLAGCLVSFVFYYFVVHMPEARRKNTIKSNLQKVYCSIKKDILWAVVHASIKGGRLDLTPDSETIERLMTAKGFKDTFKDGREANEGFYAFKNQMIDDTPERQQIVLALKMLSTQVEFVLHNYNIEDQAAFDFFKRLELVLLQLRSTGSGYDVSRLCSFIWEVCAGWSYSDGDMGYDIIQKMIDGI